TAAHVPATARRGDAGHRQLRADPGRLPAVAADGDDERVPRRRRLGPLARRYRQRHLLRAQRRAAVLPLRHGATVNAPVSAQGNRLQLTLATGAFALCFAVFGSVSAMMPNIQQRLALTELQAWVAIALPVLLGSLGRIRLGLLTDRFGGRIVYAWTMLLSIIPCVLLGFVQNYWQLLACGFFVGIGLASFAVGAAFTSRWYPPQKQGSALGIYGAGNIGQSLAAFGAPLLVMYAGYRWGFWTFALLLAVWLVLFVAMSENAPAAARPRSLQENLEPLRAPMTWVLSLYY